MKLIEAEKKRASKPRCSNTTHTTA